MQGTGNSEWTLIANRFSCLTVSHFEKCFPSFAFSQSWIDVVLPKAFAEILNQKVPEGARRDKLAQFLFLVIEEYHWQGWWKWFPQVQTAVWTDCVWGWVSLAVSASLCCSGLPELSLSFKVHCVGDGCLEDLYLKREALPYFPEEFEWQGWGV